MRTLLTAVAALTMLAACGQTTTVTTPADTPEAPVVAAPANAAEATAQDTCGASQYAAMVGQNVAAVTVPEGTRTIAPDTMVTQDFRADRLNMIVDATGVIQRFECY